MQRSAGFDRLTLRVAAASLDAVVSELWERDTLGIETRDDEDQETTVLAYFEGEPRVLDQWRVELGAVAECEIVDVERIEPEDWLAVHRSQAEPIKVGNGFLVDPREPSSATSVRPAAVGRRTLLIPARTAFGTGSHESTRLAAELLEEMDLAGRAVLDVGAGSGILSMIATERGASAVVAVELDPVAALLASQNQTLNDLRFSLVAGGIRALARIRRFDLALVNVIPELIERDLDEIAARLAIGSEAIFSGFLDEAASSWLERLQRRGFERVSVAHLGGWCAFVVGFKGK